MTYTKRVHTIMAFMLLGVNKPEWETTGVDPELCPNVNPMEVLKISHEISKMHTRQVKKLLAKL